MNAEYLKDQICDELRGAKDYAKRAIEIKAMAPSWSSVLIKMSATEHDHAINLFKMFKEYYSKISDVFSVEVPEYLRKIDEEINEMYEKYSMKIKYLHEVYNK